MSDRKQPKDADQGVRIPLDPEQALNALLRVDPDSEPGDEESPDLGDAPRAKKRENQNER